MTMGPPKEREAIDAEWVDAAFEAIAAGDLEQADQKVMSWRRLIEVHPGRCSAMSTERYRKAVTGEVPLNEV